MAKKPIPTEANPHPATSLYLKAPKAMSAKPMITIIKVAQANTVFLFIELILGNANLQKRFLMSILVKDIQVSHYNLKS